MQNSVAAKGRDVKHGAPQRAMCRRAWVRKRIRGTGKIAFYFCSFVNILDALLICPHDAVHPASERCPEIGIRRAVGAKKLDILLQFIVESVLISLIGGSVGVIGGIAVYYLSLLWLGYAEVSLLSPIMLAVFISLLIGLFAGIYPAYKAANLHPIEALRNV